MSDLDDMVLLYQAPDRPGTLAALSDALSHCGADIRDAQSFGDESTGRFFVRMLVRLPRDGATRFSDAMALYTTDNPAVWRLSAVDTPKRMIMAVSRFDHCLVDLLHRRKIGALKADIVAVISNHEDARSLVEWHGIAFHHLPVTAATKSQQETQFLTLVDELKTDLVVLARYMQILSPDMCKALANRCINIHHSFLPSFKGAKPYQQAFARGVKLIGATAHYVTTDLDEGPIIEQDVRRVTHATTAHDMIAIGREIEASVLARAVRWHLEERVMLNGQKTVVFN